MVEQPLQETSSPPQPTPSGALPPGFFWWVIPMSVGLTLGSGIGRKYFGEVGYWLGLGLGSALGGIGGMMLAAAMKRTPRPTLKNLVGFTVTVLVMGLIGALGVVVFGETYGGWVVFGAIVLFLVFAMSYGAWTRRAKSPSAGG